VSNYDIDIERLRMHSYAVDARAAGVRQAREAAVTTLDPQAFGVLCAFLAPPAMLVCGTAAAAAGALADELARTADKVRTMADRYQGVEDQSETDYRRAQRDFSTTLGGPQ
jgi:hypothetical protein